jgi:hypothetical protein
VTGTTAPSILSAHPAKYSRYSAEKRASPIVKPWGIPISSLATRPMSIASSARSWARRSSSFRRSWGGESAHPESSALRAAVTAASTSSTVPVGTEARGLPVVGLRSWIVSPAPSRHSPPMNSLVTVSVVMSPPAR